ncbi:MAG: ADP-forming succinate--CoA ligase subunit beta [Acidobacteria bacterium]|nr:ADP-forming succinate--CoA ligase subunit beta [Acidobacteriota bacterium]
MRIHEFQAKSLLAGFGIPVPRGEAVRTPAEARAAAERLGGPILIKAQIHAGGRAKAGGVLKAGTPAEAEAAAARLLGRPLVTAQTGPEGRVVHRVLVEEALKIEREFYLGLTVSREEERLVLLVSPMGGVDVEALALDEPDLILRQRISPSTGLRPFQAKRAAFAFGLAGPAFSRAVKLVADLVRAFEATDASLVEINPLALAAGGELVAADAKMEFDDNGLARRPEVKALRDPDEESPQEREASLAGLSYVKLDGDVGCMVNGAGLAMATMDLIALSGGRPANFLDVGGGVTEEAVATAFAILAADPGVRSALVNIFGGIVRCDLVAQGIVRAAREHGLRIPVVTRLEGTNVDAGRKILADSGLPFTTAPNMEAAAREAVRLARGRGGAG